MRFSWPSRGAANPMPCADIRWKCCNDRLDLPNTHLNSSEAWSKTVVSLVQWLSPATSGTILQWKFYFPPSERTARKVYHSRNQARADVFDFIERFYNRKRRHSTTGYLSPIEFERRAEVTQATVNKTGGISERGKPITLPFVFRANPTYRPPPYFP